MPTPHCQIHLLSTHAYVAEMASKNCFPLSSAYEFVSYYHQNLLALKRIFYAFSLDYATYLPGMSLITVALGVNMK